MNYAEICIIKRDGKREDFSISKIKNAISKAFNATGIQDEQQLVADITMNVISQFATPTITVEEIQDLVEKALMKVRPEVAKKYIIYREWRNTERDKKTQMKHVMDGIVAIDKNDVNLSNANMSSHTPAGQMMTFASEVTKDYTYKYLLPKRFAEAHQLGGDGLIQMLQQAQHMGFCAAGVSAADEMNDLHGMPFFPLSANRGCEIARNIIQYEPDIVQTTNAKYRRVRAFYGGDHGTESKTRWKVQHHRHHRRDFDRGGGGFWSLEAAGQQRRHRRRGRRHGEGDLCG